jgi:hypothetical protein
MEGEAAVGLPFFQWLKPRFSSSSSRSSSYSSSSEAASMASGIRHQDVAAPEEECIGGGQEVSSVRCLPLLSRLEEGKRPDDHESRYPTIKEEIVMRGDASGGMWQSGVDLNIGLPIGDDEDATMDEKDDDEDYHHQEEEDAVEGGEEEDREEWKHMHGGCKAERVELAAAPSVEGSSKIIVGEIGPVGVDSGVATGSQYWIPTPAQILIGPVQFVCHVCNKAFNRYNNMQVYTMFLFFCFPVMLSELATSAFKISILLS